MKKKRSGSKMLGTGMARRAASAKVKRNNRLERMLDQARKARRGK